MRPQRPSSLARLAVFLLLGGLAAGLTSLACSKETNVTTNNNNTSNTTNNVTLVLGAEGGFVENAPVGGRLDLPPGALTEEVTLIIGELADPSLLPLPAGVVAVSKLVSFEPHGQTFAIEIKLTLADAAGTRSDVTLLRAEPGGAWAPATHTELTSTRLQCVCDHLVWTRARRLLEGRLVCGLPGRQQGRTGMRRVAHVDRARRRLVCGVRQRMFPELRRSGGRGQRWRCWVRPGLHRGLFRWRGKRRRWWLGSRGLLHRAGAPECPGEDNDCQTRTCVGQKCGFSYTGAGVALPQQTAGDCKEVVCNGVGGTMTQNADSDVPVDGMPCTKDVCTSGTPSNPPESPGTDCGGGNQCDASGQCVTP